MLNGMIQVTTDSAVKTKQNEVKTPFWFREETAELAMVTSESSNSELSIEEIAFWTGTAKQVECGIICEGRLVLKHNCILRFKVVLRTNDELKTAYPIAWTNAWENPHTSKKSYDVYLGDVFSAQILRLFEASYKLDYAGLYDYLTTKSSSDANLLDDED